MTRRRRPLVALVLACALVAAGCSGDDDELRADDFATVRPTTTVAATSPEELPVPPPVGDAVELDLEVPRRIPAAPFTWPVVVTNTTDAPVKLTFATAQRGDLVLRRGDDEVRRWSDGRFFAQAETEQVVAPGESVTFELADDLTGVEPGFYDATVTLANTDGPMPLETDVRIVAPPDADG